MTSKRIFPKLKKKLKWFLTDESWKISKKDALWLAVWSALITWINEAVSRSHSNACVSANNPSTVRSSANTPQDEYCGLPWSIWWASFNWSVNWHYSSSSSLTWTAWLWHSSHSSHGSHGSHGSRR